MANNVFTTKLKSIIVPGDLKEFKTEQEYIMSIKRVFLVMQYVELDLKKLIISETWKFEKDHLKIIFYNMLCAVKFMHASGVMHRDLKPANILIDKECSVRICDFGLARTFPKV